MTLKFKFLVHFRFIKLIDNHFVFYGRFDEKALCQRKAVKLEKNKLSIYSFWHHLFQERAS